MDRAGRHGAQARAGAGIHNHQRECKLMAWTRDEMAARAAKELRDGYYVNLGIGIPKLVANHIPHGVDVTLQSENGMLGIGPFPYPHEVAHDLLNARKHTAPEINTPVYFRSIHEHRTN